MRTANITAIVLAALIATADALNCRQCTHRVFCLGDLRQCPSPDDVCAAIQVIQYSTAMKLEPLFMMTCVKPKVCHQAYGMLSTAMGLHLSISCCDSDGCHPATPPLTMTSPIPNGLTCKKCFAKHSDTCEGRHSMQCIGDLTRCVHLAETTTHGLRSLSFATQGCATENFCDVGIGMIHGVDVTIDFTTICSSPVGSSQESIERLDIKV